MTTKSERVKMLIDYYANGRQNVFAEIVDVKPQTINSWLVRNTLDAERIYAKCVGVSAEWLLTGDGDMIRTVNKLNEAYKEEIVENYEVDD